jgi:hypothetical protein
VRKCHDRGTRPGRWFLWGAVAVTLTGGLLRAAYLDHPMRYDESMVYFNYLIFPLHEVAARYDAVQNHVLHTMLQHETLRWLGNRPWALRLPAFIFGTMLVPLSIWLSYAMVRREIFALLSGGLVAVSSLLIDYSTNGRGYTMVCAFTLGMCLCTIGLIRTPGRRRLWLLWAVLGAMGAFTIPVMLFPVAGLFVLLALDAWLLRRPRRRRVQLSRLVAASATMAVMTALLYLPAVIHVGSGELARARDCIAQFSRHHVGSFADMAAVTWQHWSRDVSIVSSICAAIGLLYCIRQAFRRRNLTWLMPLILLLAGLGVSRFLPVSPYPRVWLYLLPIVLTFSVCGLGALDRRELRNAAAIAAAVGVVITGHLTMKRQYLVAEDPHTLVDAERVAGSFADLPEREFAVLTKPATYAVRYYARIRGWPQAAHPAMPQVTETYIVVNHTQALEEVLQSKIEHLQGYGKPTLFKRLPNATIYRMPRIEPQLRVADRS